MEKRALHSLVKAAARNAYRRAAVRGVVKTAAASALRRQDLRGAILAVVNGEKVAAKMKIPGKLFNRAGQFFTTAGKEGFRPALSKARGVIGNTMKAHGGFWGTVGHGAAVAGRDMAELGRRGYGGIKRRVGEFSDTVSGNRLNRFRGETGLSDKGWGDLVRRGEGLLAKARDPAAMAKQDRRVLDIVKNTLKGDSAGVRRTYANAQARTAARLKAEMLRARTNAALAAAGTTVGGLGLYGLYNEPGLDYMEG